MVGFANYHGAMTERRPTDDELLAALVARLFDFSKRLQGEVADVLADLQLTEALADALWQLDPAAPPPSMRQVAAGLRCDPSTVTFLADRLTERGLIEVHVNPADRRSKSVTLTPKGIRTRRRLLEAMTARSTLARLSHDEQRQLHDLLSRASGAPALPRRGTD